MINEREKLFSMGQPQGVGKGIIPVYLKLYYKIFFLIRYLKSTFTRSSILTGIKKASRSFPDGRQKRVLGNDGFLVVKYKMPEFKTATIRI